MICQISVGAIYALDKWIHGTAVPYFQDSKGIENAARGWREITFEGKKIENSVLYSSNNAETETLMKAGSGFASRKVIDDLNEADKTVALRIVPQLALAILARPNAF